MPSIINSDISAPSSALDYLSGDDHYFNRDDTSAQPSARTEAKGIKASQRPQWYDPDDEFSVPVHTEHPLIDKRPLDVSSFLLHHRIMHRSIEIMTPPSCTETAISRPASPGPNSTGSIQPAIPDGPIYIHHRSTLAGGPLSNAIACAHIGCFDHRHSHGLLPSRSAATPCLKSRLGISIDDDNSHTDGFHRSFEADQEDRGISRTPSPFAGMTSTSAMASTGLQEYGADTRIALSAASSEKGEHSFLESHISSISQWLAANSRS